MTDHPIVARFGILCDQVRREDNGKLLMIGIYAHNISVASLPIQLPLSLVIGVWSKKPTIDHPIAVRVRFNDSEIFKGDGSITINEAGADIIVLPGIILSATSIGKLEVSSKLGADRWRTIATIPLVQKKA